MNKKTASRTTNTKWRINDFYTYTHVLYIYLLLYTESDEGLKTTTTTIRTLYKPRNGSPSNLHQL